MIFSLFITMFFCTFFVVQPSGSQDISTTKLINNTQSSISSGNVILTTRNGGARDMTQNIAQRLPQNATVDMKTPTTSNLLTKGVDSTPTYSSVSTFL
jgi:hypothetical protein